jgi:aminoglycoside phosphotransferase (APT) family kinase protein
MADDYQQHLAGLHAKLQTPDAVILAALAEVSPSRVVARRRIVEGEANEAHAFRLADGLELVMRIARNARGFENERWAIEACAREGVPVPQVLLIRRFETEAGPIDICIQRKLPGELLSNRLGLPRETLRALTRQAGELLSRVHRVRTTGLGYIDGHGVGPFADFEALMADFLGQAAAYADLAARHALDPTLVARAFTVIEAAVRDAAPVRTCLIHNDFLPKHLLVHDGQITGLIDFGEVSGESPVMEFVKWDYLVGDALPLAWLREGYADQSLFDEGYARLFPALGLMTSLCLLAWYDGEGFAAGVATAKARLLRDVARLGRSET